MSVSIEYLLIIVGWCQPSEQISDFSTQFEGLKILIWVRRKIIVGAMLLLTSNKEKDKTMFYSFALFVYIFYTTDYK